MFVIRKKNRSYQFVACQLLLEIEKEYINGLSEDFKQLVSDFATKRGFETCIRFKTLLYRSSSRMPVSTNTAH